MNNSDIPEHLPEDIKSALASLLQNMIENDTPVVLTPFTAEVIILEKAKAKFDVLKAKRIPILYFSVLFFFNAVLKIFVEKDTLWSIIFLCTSIGFMAFWCIHKRKFAFEKTIIKERKDFFDNIYKASTQYEIDQLTGPGGIDES